MSDSTPADSPPPPRKTSNYLLLAVNVIILLFAIYIVWTKMQERGSGDSATGDDVALRDGQRTGTAGGGVAGPQAPVRVRGQTGGAGGGGVVTGAGPSVTEVRMRGGADGGGSSGARLADDVEWTKPVDYDESTLRSLAGTESAIDGLGVELEVYNAIHGQYPSSAMDFGTNRGVEALHAALDEAGRLDGVIAGDTDGDGRAELLDGWGRPLVYFSPDDYGNAQDWADADDATAQVEAARSRARDIFQAPSRFQLWSAGPDGKNEGGAGDDVTSWIIRD